MATVYKSGRISGAAVYADGVSAAAAGTGSLTATQGANTLASAGTLALKSSLASTQADNTLVAAGTVSLKGNASTTQGANSLAATGALALKAIVSAGQAGNTISAFGGLAIKATATIAQGDTTLVATGVGSSVITGSVTSVQAGNAASIFVGRANCIVTGNTVEKIGGAVAWDSDACSVIGFTGGAYVSAQAGQTNLDVMLGLNTDPVTDQSYASIDYAIYLNAIGNIYVYESGVSIGGFGVYITTDVLSVAYNGTNIVYAKNGVTFRTVAATITAPLYFDSSFLNPGAKLNNITFSAGAGLTKAEPFSGSLRIAGLLNVSQDGNSTSISGTLALKGFASAMQASNDAVSSATLLIKGILSATQGSNTLASSAGPNVTAQSPLVMDSVKFTYITNDKFNF